MFFDGIIAFVIEVRITPDHVVMPAVDNGIPLGRRDGNDKAGKNKKYGSHFILYNGAGGKRYDGRNRTT
jgi:hypothetical protein